MTSIIKQKKREREREREREQERKGQKTFSGHETKIKLLLSQIFQFIYAKRPMDRIKGNSDDPVLAANCVYFHEKNGHFSLIKKKKNDKNIVNQTTLIDKWTHPLTGDRIVNWPSRCKLADSSTVICWTSPFDILRCRVYFVVFVLFRRKILLANTIDPDQTPHYVAYDLGLLYLLATLLRVSR